MRGTLLATVLRGLRSRALLSAGSVLLIALAIGSAVLGPIFQVAVTNSYLVSRLNDVPNYLSGLTWEFHPDAKYDGSPLQALQQATSVTDDRVQGPFAPSQAWLQTNRFDVPDLYRGVPVQSARVRLIAQDGACAHLEIRGRCPRSADEMLVLPADLEKNDLRLGDTVDLGVPTGKKTVVGTYRIPESAEDHWFDSTRFGTVPATQPARGPATPYQPAPFIVPTSAFDDLHLTDFDTSQYATWEVLVDRRLDVPPTATYADLVAATRAAASVRDDQQAHVAGGRLAGSSINDLGTIAHEISSQRDTAKASVGPAVLSLVLVAMALLMRLLMAAADLRLPELALASLRGLGSRQMWQLGLSEPLALLGISLPVGAFLGVAGAWTLVRLWLLPGLPVPLPWTSLVAGALVAVATALVAVLATGLVLRVSLSEQLTGVRRPRSSSRTAVVLQLALVAAAIAVLASKLSGGAPGRPDLTDLILPVLLAVVAGLAATRSTAWLARWWTRRRPRGRSLPAFVAARAISRRQEGTLVILPVTAAIAVCVFGFGVYDSAASWRASVAATSAPADEVWTSPLPMSQTVGLTRQIDPRGRYLMAANQISSLGPTYMVVDTPRMGRVAIWPDQWTPGHSAAEVARALEPRAPIPHLVGRTVGLTVDNRTKTRDLTVRLRLNVLSDRPHFAFLGPFRPGTSTRVEKVPFCADGCDFDGITVAGPAALTDVLNGRVTLSRFTVDGKVDPTFGDAGWGVMPQSTGADAVVDVRTSGGALTADLSSGSQAVLAQFSAGRIPDALPVARGVKSEVGPQTGTVHEDVSSEFPNDPVFRAGSVPFLGPQGVLIDYTMMNANREIFPQATPVYVLLRSDTPASMLAQLRDSGVARTTTFAEVRSTLDQGAYALALRLYAVVAGLVLLMALAGLFVSTAVQLPARRRDAASLRVVGVPRRSVMSAVLRELAVVLGGTALAGLAAGTVAQYVVLRTVTLGTVDNVQTPALVAAISPARLLLLAVVAAAVFATVALVSASLTVRGARGATLRENAR